MMANYQGLVEYGEKLLHNAETGTGAGSNTIDVSGYDLCMFQFAGTGTIQFEATVNESDWVAVQAKNMNDGTEATTATAAGLYRCETFGISEMRINITVAGTVTVLARASA